MLNSQQFAAGNRDGVGCTVSVLQKISSEARLQLQEDKDLILSLLMLQRRIVETENVHTALPSSCLVKGFIQHIQAYPFSVTCLNQAAVRLYHDVAKTGTILCDAPVTYHINAKRGRKVPYSLLLCHCSETPH